jgi:two-component system cell cycle response regulator
MSPVSVLLVDDSASQRAVIAHRLVQGGFEVAVATDGEDCLRVLGELRPDIVLLDVVMPGIDGWETLDRIRQTNGVPVIMLTARAEEIDRVRGLRAGADDYIGKPFQQDELEARIEAVMRRADLGRRDALTGLSNRRTFDEHLDSMLAQERKTGQAFALVIFDIDHFKSINDTQGHPEGDRVLQDVARIAARQLRAGEQIFRIGGEEFGIVIPGDGKTGVRVAPAHVVGRRRLVPARCDDARGALPGSRSRALRRQAGRAQRRVARCLNGTRRSCRRRFDRRRGRA